MRRSGSRVLLWVGARARTDWAGLGSFSVLGIETSCDDSCVALVSSEGRVLSHLVSSQFAVHAPYNGIVPSLAARAHEANLDLLLEQALSVADAIGSPPLRLIAVTAGPGLKPCLSVGIDRAKNLSLARQLPLLPVHHLEAHALVTRLPQEGAEAPSFPFLLLLVSGGHTQLIACDRVGEYRILGTTLDDAVGEAFDKTARLLGIEASPLCHPGEQLESLALGGNPKAIPFTRPLQRRKGSCEFSYSGLKTQVRRFAEKEDITPSAVRKNVAAAFQDTATMHLVDRVKNALVIFPCKSLVVAGGVARNQHIRSQLSLVASLQEGLTVFFPPLPLCTDNGVMVAWAAIERVMAGPTRTYDPEEHSLIVSSPRWEISAPLPTPNQRKEV